LLWSVLQADANAGIGPLASECLKEALRNFAASPASHHDQPLRATKMALKAESRSFGQPAGREASTVPMRIVLWVFRGCLGPVRRPALIANVELRRKTQTRTYGYYL
jgi:hypothetical protein